MAHDIVNQRKRVWLVITNRKLPKLGTLMERAHPAEAWRLPSSFLNDNEDFSDAATRLAKELFGKTLRSFGKMNEGCTEGGTEEIYEQLHFVRPVPEPDQLRQHCMRQAKWLTRDELIANIWQQLAKNEKVTAGDLLYLTHHTQVRNRKEIFLGHNFALIVH